MRCCSDNLFGLELDPNAVRKSLRSTSGITAWKLAGYRPLPLPCSLACAGLGINVTQLFPRGRRSPAGMIALAENAA